MVSRGARGAGTGAAAGATEALPAVLPATTAVAELGCDAGFSFSAPACSGGSNEVSGSWGSALAAVLLLAAGMGACATGVGVDCAGRLTNMPGLVICRYT